MTELEILAQLKMSYRYIDDIIDNADCTQIKDTEDLQQVLNILQAKYDEVYKKIPKEKLFYEKDLKIADLIYFDYVTESGDYDDQYLTYLDVDTKYPWWENIIFLRK